MVKDEGQIDKLLENTQRLILNELGIRIKEIESLFYQAIDKYAELDNKLIDDFLSFIKDISCVLRCDFCLPILGGWESALNNIIEYNGKLDKDICDKLEKLIRMTKKEIERINKEYYLRMNIYQGNQYTNMPDRGKVLVVDNDIRVLKLLEGALTLEGYRVYICTSGRKTMDMIQVIRPNIMILDITMPGLNSLNLLEELKTESEYEDTFILLSGRQDRMENIIKGIKLGADDYINKPYIIEDIITRVEMIMRKSKYYREKLLRDSLTEAFSKYYFNLRIAEEVERYRRYGNVFSIAFIDMDYYRLINEKHGHQVGDYVLKKLVEYIIKNIRKCDSIYRYDGEEFMIILPETCHTGAYKVIERLRQGFSAKPIDLNQDKKLHVSFSAGIKQISDKGERVDDIINDVHKAMYWAKRHGRDKVVVYNKEMENKNLDRTLLIVDDEHTISGLLRERISSIGYNVVTVPNGEIAVNLARQLNPDAILLDLPLPDIEGFEICRLIKANSKRENPKIIMVSKSKGGTNIAKGLECGVDDYVSQPFLIKELEERLMRALNKID